MILVLGGAGYVGSHAVRALRANGREVVVVDNLSTGNRESVPEEIPFVPIDLRNFQDLQQVFRDYPISAVMHFCASSLVGESMEKPLLYFENNVYGAINVLKCMVEFGVKHIVFSSTAAVYGEPEVVPITEESPKKPQSPYGESKLMMETLFRWASDLHGIRYVSLRYFNVAGAHASGEIGEAHAVETHLIPIVLQVPLGQRDEVGIFGGDYPTKDGTAVRDYIHIEDLIDAHIRAVDYLAAGGESNVFNLASGTGFSVKEIVEVARNVTQHSIPATLKDRRAGDPAVLIADATKAKTVLGWEPKRDDIGTIVADAWRWHRSHPNGYRQ